MEVGVGLNVEPRNALPICELESPLRSGWERCLDLKSGLIFFKNWETGRRTYARPGELRLSSNRARTSCKELELFPSVDRSRDLSKAKCAIPPSPSSSSAVCFSSSSSSSASSVNFGAGGRGKGKRKRPTTDDDVASRAMVLAGCPRCLMYVMFCNSNRKCPNCGHGFPAGQGIDSCKRRA